MTTEEEPVSRIPTPDGPDLSKSSPSKGSSSSLSSSAKSMNASPEPVLPDLSSLDMFYIGVGRDSLGHYVIFPPDGGEPMRARTEQAAVLLMADIVLEIEPELRPADGSPLPWKDYEAAVQAITADLLEIGASSTAGVSEGGTLESREFLSIDPMRFLKSGDRLRIRAIRVLETTPAALI